MKDYVIETLKKSKGNAYKVMKKNTELMGILETRYPHVTDFRTKVQLYIRDMNDVPVCQNSGCSNSVRFLNGEFIKFCSIECTTVYRKENNLYHEMHLKAVQTNLERYGVEITSQCAVVREKTKQTNLERYGVEVPAKNSKIREKMKQTNIERYGVEHAVQNAEIREKMKQTNIERYGVENPTQNAEIREKTKQTNIERYGVEHYSQTKEFTDTIKKNYLEKYGVDFYTQTDEFKDKVKKVNIEKYGVEHYSQTKEYKDKVRQTSIEKYGTESYLQTEEYKEKVKQTNLDRYGVENYTQTEEYLERLKLANLEKYGTDFYVKTDEFKAKSRETNLDRYGVENYSQTDECKEKVKQANLDKYGVEYYTQTDDYKEKTTKSNLDKYGVEYYTQTDDYKEKTTKSNLDKYGVSSPTKKHYNPEYANIFDDVNNFITLLYEHGTYKLAELVNCDVSSIYSFASKNNIQLPPRPKSYQEELMTDFLIQNNIPFVSNTKKILPSGKELDFYFSNHNLAIEINGIYWHSEISGGKDKKYHYNKWKECSDNGITLLSIYEDEFKDNQQFWLNKILYMTGKMKPTKIHARKCEVIELDTVSEFLNEHHLQGSCASTYKFGLFYDQVLVSVMTFSNTRNNKAGTIDLSRFCNHSDYLVSGGASKLLSHFIKTHGSKYNEITSFSDNNYSNGNVYEKLGFTLADNIRPDYKYVSANNYLDKYHKAGFRKSEIFRKFDIPDTMKTASEWELMQYLGYDRIWDSGKKKWKLNI
jgi:hypothetical protein